MIVTQFKQSVLLPDGHEPWFTPPLKKTADGWKPADLNKGGVETPKKARPIFKHKNSLWAIAEKMRGLGWQTAILTKTIEWAEGVGSTRVILLACYKKEQETEPAPKFLGSDMECVHPGIDIFNGHCCGCQNTLDEIALGERYSFFITKIYGPIFDVGLDRIEEVPAKDEIKDEIVEMNRQDDPVF